MKVSLEVLLHPLFILPEVAGLKLYDRFSLTSSELVCWILVSHQLDSDTATNGSLEIVIKLSPHPVQTNRKMGPFPPAATICIHPQAHLVPTGPSVKWFTVPFFPTLLEFTDTMHDKGAWVDRVVTNGVSQCVKAGNEL